MEFTTNSQILSSWLNNLKLDGISDKTIRWYAYGLKRFNNYTDKNYNEVTSNDIKKFLAYLKDNNFSMATAKGNFRTLKIFYGYLIKKRIIAAADDPFKDLKTPKFDIKQINSFNRIEMEEILSSFNKKEFLQYRDYAILCTLFSTGLRKSELVAMTVSDVDRNGVGYFRVTGKGNKERVIPIGSVLALVLKRYIRRRRKFLDDKGYKHHNGLWVNNRGKTMTASGVDGIFDKLKRTDYPWSTRVSAHTVRHTFATMFLVNGGDVFTLQRLLGHSDISTTKIYIDLKTDYIKRQGDNFNPLDNTTWKLY